MIAFAALATVCISLLTDRKKNRLAKAEADRREAADEQRRAEAEAKRIAELEDATDVTFQKLNNSLAARLARVEAERDELEKRIRDHEGDLDRIRAATAGTIHDLERRLAKCDQDRRDLKLELFELQRDKRGSE